MQQQQEKLQNVAATAVGQKQMLSHQTQQIAMVNKKLTIQAERILKWKMHMDLELKCRDKKMKEFEDITVKHRGNMFNQQTQFEKLSQQLQTECQNRGELLQKIEKTRQISSILQKHCNQLSETLKKCFAEKEILKSVYDDQIKEIDELTQKFSNLNQEYSFDLEELTKMLNTEKEVRVKTVVNLKDMRAKMEQHLKFINNILQTEKEQSRKLTKELESSNMTIKDLCYEQEKHAQHLQELKKSSEETKTKLTAEREKLSEELSFLQETLTLEKQKSEALVAQNEETRICVKDFAKSKEILEESYFQMKETIAHINLNIFAEKEELDKKQVELSELLNEKQVLEAKVSELETLQTELSALREVHQLSIKEGEKEQENLQTTLDSLQHLKEIILHNEGLMEKLNSEQQTFSSQASRLEKKNAELDEMVNKSNDVNVHLTKNIEDLKIEIELKCKMVEDLKTDKSSSSTSSMAEQEEAQEVYNVLKVSSKQLQTDLEMLNQKTKDLEDKVQSLQEEKNSLEKMLEEERLKREADCASLAKKEGNISVFEVQLSSLVEEKRQMEAREQQLLQQIVKLSTEKNEATSNAAYSCSENEKAVAELREKIPKMTTVLKMYKEQRDGLTKQQTAKIESLEVKCKELNQLKLIAEDNLCSSERQLTDTLQKMQYQAEKNENKIKKLQAKLNATLECLKDTHSKKSIISKPQSQNEIKDLPTSGSQNEKRIKNIYTPMTPKLQLSQSCEPQRGIMRTSKSPRTPVSSKKVMFRDVSESSDMDDSTVNITVLDEKEVNCRLEAMQRCVSPRHMVQSPKIINTFKRKDLVLGRPGHNLVSPKQDSSQPLKKVRHST